MLADSSSEDHDTLASPTQPPSASEHIAGSAQHRPPHLNLPGWGSVPASPSTSSFNPPTSASSGPHRRQVGTAHMDFDRIHDTSLNSPPIPTSAKEKHAMAHDEESRFNTATTATRVNGHSRTGTGTTVTDAPRTPQTGSSFAVLRRATTSLLTPDRRLGPAPTTWQSLKSILFASWLNVLLVFIPVSWALHFALPASTRKDTIVFITSFLAIIPLAKLLAFATDDLSIRVGQTLAGLLNATLGNAVELIISIIALIKCELRIVQASLVGSILSNLLLVLGMCFFAGGLKFSEQGFGVSATQLNSSLLTISVIAILLPAAFHFALGPGTATDPSPVVSPAILDVSHGVAVILLIIYIAYLWFQLVSHTTLYEDEGDHVIKTTRYADGTRKFGLKPKQPKKLKDDVEAPGSYPSRVDGGGKPASFASGTVVTDVPSRVMAMSRTAAAVAEPGLDTMHASKEGNHVAFVADPVTGAGSQTDHSDEEDEGETPQMSLVMCIVLLVVVTVLVALTAEWLVDSINGLTESGTIKKEFVGVILLPIAGNAAEHVTAVTVSVKDKLNLSLGVAVGSSIQIALFVIPFIVILGWILGKPLSMLFDPYESIAMFLAVLTVNYVVQDGKSNWLEGFILMMLYLILAVTFWFYGGAPGFDQFNC